MFNAFCLNLLGTVYASPENKESSFVVNDAAKNMLE